MRVDAGIKQLVRMWQRKVMQRSWNSFFPGCLGPCRMWELKNGERLTFKCWSAHGQAVGASVKTGFTLVSQISRHKLSLWFFYSVPAAIYAYYSYHHTPIISDRSLTPGPPTPMTVFSASNSKIKRCDLAVLIKIKVFPFAYFVFILFIPWTQRLLNLVPHWSQIIGCTRESGMMHHNWYITHFSKTRVISVFASSTQNYRRPSFYRIAPKLDYRDYVSTSWLDNMHW